MIASLDTSNESIPFQKVNQIQVDNNPKVKTN